MTPVRLLVIGAGAIGRTHIDRIGRSPQLALAGIADPTDAGRALADCLGVPWAASHTELVEKPVPDLSLWHYRGERSWHAEITREQTVALKADPYTAQLLHFAAVIRGEEALLCSALDGLRTLQATLAVLEAATAGAPVSCTASASPTTTERTP